MASEQDGAAVFPDEEDLDDDDDSQDEEEEEELLHNHAVLPDDDDDDDVFDDDSNSASTSSSLPTATPLDPLLPLPLPLPLPPSSSSSAAAAVTVAVPAPIRPDPLPVLPTPPLPSSSSASAVSIAAPAASPVPPIVGTISPSELKRPSPAVTVAKPLFQRLWTDEDEIELLRGFLEYTTQRGGAPSGGHHDTAAFYDQIKCKLQLDFNKNQLVEKLRRLKKKYRNVVGRMSSGKDFSFKSPHDQATFEISRRIWTNVTAAATPGSNNDPIDDEDDTLRNPNFNNHLFSTPNPNPFFDPTTTPTKSRKRQRPPHPQPHPQQVQVQLQQVKLEERNLGVDGPTVSNHANPNLNLNANASASASANANVNPNVAVVIEDTVRSCLSPLFKELLSGATMGGGFGGGGSRGGFGYVAAALNPLPFSYGVGFGVGNTGDITDERWRKQQIMELEVYSKRLELVQDHIKATIEELRSSGGG